MNQEKQAKYYAKQEKMTKRLRDGLIAAFAVCPSITKFYYSTDDGSVGIGFYTSDDELVELEFCEAGIDNAVRVDSNGRYVETLDNAKLSPAVHQAVAVLNEAKWHEVYKKELDMVFDIQRNDRRYVEAELEFTRELVTSPDFDLLKGIKW